MEFDVLGFCFCLPCEVAILFPCRYGSILTKYTEVFNSFFIIFEASSRLSSYVESSGISIVLTD